MVRVRVIFDFKLTIPDEFETYIKVHSGIRLLNYTATETTAIIEAYGDMALRELLNGQMLDITMSYSICKSIRIENLGQSGWEDAARESKYGAAFAKNGVNIFLFFNGKQYIQRSRGQEFLSDAYFPENMDWQPVTMPHYFLRKILK